MRLRGDVPLWSVITSHSASLLEWHYHRQLMDPSVVSVSACSVFSVWVSVSACSVFSFSSSVSLSTICHLLALSSTVQWGTRTLAGRLCSEDCRPVSENSGKAVIAKLHYSDWTCPGLMVKTADRQFQGLGSRISTASLDVAHDSHGSLELACIYIQSKIIFKHSYCVMYM